MHPASDDTEELARELHQRGEQFKTLLDRAPLGVYLMDGDLRICEINPIAQAIFGEATGDVIGRAFTEILHILWQKPYAEKLERIFRNTLQTGDSYVAAARKEYRVDRERFEVYEWRVDRIVLPDGQYGLVCYFRDVAQQLATREALHETDRRKNEFLATLAHELRNPLAPLRNGLKLMKVATDDPVVLERARAMMERQLAHMVRLIDDLLDVSRVTRDKIELHKERISLEKVIRQAVETSRPLMESRGNALTTNVIGTQSIVDGDAIRLTQVFGNLLNNATKYSEPGGHIVLDLAREGNEAVVRVRDHGCGIPPEMLSKVFDLFVQVEHPLEHSRGGLGIGLSLVRRLIEMHGGAVEARSDGPGAGSEFIVRLPISLSEMPTPQGPRNIGISANSARRRVLIADDNEDALESLAVVLRFMGHETATARDGLAALEVAQSFLPELILLDIGMPGLNGYETAARIREQPWGRGVRLVALTGWGQGADRKRSDEAGFDLHMVKPIDPAVIERLLAELPSS